MYNKKQVESRELKLKDSHRKNSLVETIAVEIVNDVPLWNLYHSYASAVFSFFFNNPRKWFRNKPVVILAGVKRSLWIIYRHTCRLSLIFGIPSGQAPPRWRAESDADVGVVVRATSSHRRASSERPTQPTTPTDLLKGISPHPGRQFPLVSTGETWFSNYERVGSRRAEEFC